MKTKFIKLYNCTSIKKLNITTKVTIENINNEVIVTVEFPTKKGLPVRSNDLKNKNTYQYTLANTIKKEYEEAGLTVTGHIVKDMTRKTCYYLDENSKEVDLGLYSKNHNMFLGIRLSDEIYSWQIESNDRLNKEIETELFNRRGLTYYTE